MTPPDAIKDAFAKVKADIDELRANILYINDRLDELRDLMLQMQVKNQFPQPTNQQTNTFPEEKSQQTNQHIEEKFALRENPTQNPTDSTENEAIKEQTPTDQESPPSLPTHNMPYYGLKDQFLTTSIGNEGVPTDKPTNQQTNTQQSKSPNSGFIDRLSAVTQLVNSLDDLKKEVRVKFKRLTKQEMLVFATLYQLQEAIEQVDYPQIAQKLHLSESSIRDYVQRIIRKGIPITKSKENNKKIYLTIDPDLKKIASLATIIHLRDL